MSEHIVVDGETYQVSFINHIDGEATSKTQVTIVNPPQWLIDAFSHAIKRHMIQPNDEPEIGTTLVEE